MGGRLMADVIWDPHNGKVADEPWRDPKHSLSLGMSGDGSVGGQGRDIAYARYVLWAFAGQNCRPVVNPNGPHAVSNATAQGFYNASVFFGLTPTYQCTEANGVWDVIDFPWAWNQ